MTPRRHLMLGTAGHVDHGKTALVKLLTGCNTDSLAEEQQRGLTIDLGFAPCRLADQRVVGVVDVPGHVDFIRNMVAGAQGIDVVILVVAADDGIMPQTLEHLHILTLMGLRHGVVALTKIDRVDAARRDEVRAQLHDLLADTFLRTAAVCPVSNVTGEGYDAFFDALNAVVGACEDRPSDGQFRMWVEDAFSIRGAGTVLTGIPTRGEVRPGDTLRLLPSDAVAHIRRLQVYGEEAGFGRAGECVALNAPELDARQVRRGQVLTAEASAPVNLAEGEIVALPALRAPVPDYAEVHFHVGTAAVTARLALLESAQLAPGQRQMVQLRWTEPLGLAPGERFVVRANLPAIGQSGLTTIGGGRILECSGVRLRRQRAWTHARLAERRETIDSPIRWAETLVRQSPEPLSVAGLARAGLWRLPETEALIASLIREQRLLRTPSGALVHTANVDASAAQLQSAIEAFHQTHPEKEGLSLAELDAAVRAPAELAALARQRLLATGALQSRGAVWAARDWKPRVTDQAQQAREAVAAAFRQAGWTGLTAAEFAARSGRAATGFEPATAALLAQGVLIRIDPTLVLHRDSVAAAQQVVLRLFRARPRFNTMEFRDALGVSRKYAVPLLDYLDRQRWTVRQGHDRTPGAEARKRLAPA